jgi:hypothetical protein
MDYDKRYLRKNSGTSGMNLTNEYRSFLSDSVLGLSSFLPQVENLTLKLILPC